MKYKIDTDPARDSLITPFGLAKLQGGYLQPGETPQDLYARIASHFADSAEHAQFMYDAMSQHWFSPATPVLANGGIPGKGLPISCYLTHPDDTRQGLMDHFTENAMLSSLGGGVGSYWGDIRPVGSPISRGGKATGVVPYLKVEESVINAFPQSGTRRGSVAAYLPVWHVEIEEFIAIRKAVSGGDRDRRCTSVGFHHGVVIPDAFMQAVAADGPWQLIDQRRQEVVRTVSARGLWESILEARAGSGGEPYLLFIDTVNEAIPAWHKLANKLVKTSNLCCVTADQWVPTQKGIMTVGELYEEGTENLVPGVDGKLYKASKMHLISEAEEVFEIRTKQGYTHKVTADHRVWVKGQGWVEARDLKPGDKLLIQQAEGLFGQKHNPELALIAGLVAADGTFAKASVRVDLWEGKTTFLESEVQQATHNVIAGEQINTASTLLPTFSQAKGKRHMTSAPLARVLAREGITAESKVIVPKFVREGTRETVAAFLRGIYVADGHVTVNQKAKTFTIGLASTSINFLKDVQKLWANFGVRSQFYGLHGARTTQMPDGNGGSKGYECRAVYRLYISSQAGCRLADEVIGIIAARNSKSATLAAEGLYGKDFRNPQKLEADFTELAYIGVEPVYCLEVASKTHAWVCNGLITKNSEITLPTDHERTAVCCLGSLNLETYEQWKDTPLVAHAVRFLDNVLQDFIDTAPPELAKAVYSAQQERSIGLGVMGWHSFLQSKLIPFESAMAVSWNKKIFQSLHEQGKQATYELALEKGPCPDAAEFGFMARNSNIFAIAPTASISTICGTTSPAIEPWSGNAFVAKTNAGNHLVKNKYLEALLESKGYNTPEVWESIRYHLEQLPDGRIVPVLGSAQHLNCLSDYEKAVFATGYEVDPLWIVQHAADRQPFICQSQSVNLFYDARTDRERLNKAHFMAWQLGVKSLYYCRIQHNLQAENFNGDGVVYQAAETSNSYSEDGCLACQ